MLAYRCSVSVRALLAKAIGRPSWRRAAPIPIFDASTWMVVGLVTSKYVRAMSLQMEALTFSKTFCKELFHSNGTSVRLGHSSQRGSLVCKLGDEWSHELDYAKKLVNFCDIL